MVDHQESDVTCQDRALGLTLKIRGQHIRAVHKAQRHPEVASCSNADKGITGLGTSTKCWRGAGVGSLRPTNGNVHEKRKSR